MIKPGGHDILFAMSNKSDSIIQAMNSKQNLNQKNSTKQLGYWTGKFGNDFIKRNSDTKYFAKRKSFFEQIVKKYNIRSILEIGCGIGGNLKIIAEIDPSIKLAAIEPNKKAISIARKNIPKAEIIDGNIFNVNIARKFDLVFTSVVLIHIADEDLPIALEKIYKASSKYILAIEYYSKKRKVVLYRGLVDALFKRPYDEVYLNKFPALKMIESKRLTTRRSFARCKYFLFEKK